MTINLPEKEAKRVQIAVDRNPVETSFQKWAKPGHFSRTLAKGPNTTTWIWNLHADAHDFDSHTSDLQDISRKVFSAHFGQLGIILIWLSGMYFHGARFSNYEAWLSDPTHIKPSAQIVWPIVGQEILNGDVGGGFQGVQITSGFFQLWRASGITSELQLYTTAVVGLVLAGAMFFAGWFHYHKAAPKLEWFQNVESMLNHHLAGLLGLGSLGWAGHQIHVSLPVNKLLDAGVDPKEIPLPHEFFLNKQLMIDLYPSFAKGLTPFFTLQWSEYSDFLTFKGGLNEVTGGLNLSDTAHHHLAIAVLFLIAGHMYRTNWGIGHSIKEILEAHKGPLTGEGHKGLYEILTTSWHAQLAINLALFGSLSIVVAHHMYSMPPYPYLATDYATQLSLFTHHCWIGGFCIVGAGAHAAIFMVRDYDPTNNYNNLLDRVLRHRDAIISHLNWVSIFLGFHSFGLYIHNDTMSALGRPQDMFSDTAIQLQPVFAQWVQNTHFMAPQFTAPNALAATSASWGGDVVAVGGKVAMMPISLGTADFMVQFVVDHVKLRYMLEQLRSLLISFWQP
jgi:photosystem I P700 chlorophyll a apoprotein A1